MSKEELRLLILSISTQRELSNSYKVRCCVGTATNIYDGFMSLEGGLINNKLKN